MNTLKMLTSELLKEMGVLIRSKEANLIKPKAPDMTLNSLQKLFRVVNGVEQLSLIIKVYPNRPKGSVVSVNIDIPLDGKKTAGKNTKEATVALLEGLGLTTLDIIRLRIKGMKDIENLSRLKNSLKANYSNISMTMKTLEKTLEVLRVPQIDLILTAIYNEEKYTATITRRYAIIDLR